MDVHPTKNGINRYWSIPIYIYILLYNYQQYVYVELWHDNMHSPKLDTDTAGIQLGRIRAKRAQFWLVVHSWAYSSHQKKIENTWKNTINHHDSRIFYRTLYMFYTFSIHVSLVSMHFLLLSIYFLYPVVGCELSPPGRVHSRPSLGDQRALSRLLRWSHRKSPRNTLW